MSKVVAALSWARVKDGVIGGVLALFVYVALQLLNAFLIHREVLGAESIYVAICVSAGVSSFAGCGYSVLRRGRENVLGATVVVIVFVLLTAAVGVLSGGEGAGTGMVGVGGAMAAGGLMAAVTGAMTREGSRGRYEKMRGRRRKSLL